MHINSTITLKLECNSIGEPIPIINWKFNSNRICDPPRCTETCVNGEGVLLITNATSNDSGIYTCEAINERGKALKYLNISLD